MAAPSSLPSAQVQVPHLSPIFLGTMKCKVFDVTVGPKYYTASPGIPLSLAQLNVSDVYFVSITQKNATTGTFVWQYDYVNKCIRAYRQSAASAALQEVPDSDTAFAGTEQLRVLVFGV